MSDGLIPNFIDYNSSKIDCDTDSKLTSGRLQSSKCVPEKSQKKNLYLFCMF